MSANKQIETANKALGDLADTVDISTTPNGTVVAELRRTVARTTQETRKLVSDVLEALEMADIVATAAEPDDLDLVGYFSKPGKRIKLKFPE
jgi:hypothetical protein